MLKRLFRDFGIYGIAPFVPKVASIFILPLITPFLTKQDFGIYGIITAYTGFFQIFFTLGLNVNLSNSFFKSRMQYQWLWRQIYGFWVLWAVVYGLIISIVIWIFTPKAALDNRNAIILLSVIPIVLFGPTAMIAQLYYQFKKKALQVGLRSAIFGTLNILITSSLTLQNRNSFSSHD